MSHHRHALPGQGSRGPFEHPGHIGARTPQGGARVPRHGMDQPGPSAERVRGRACRARACRRRRGCTLRRIPKRTPAATGNPPNHVRQSGRRACSWRRSSPRCASIPVRAHRAFMPRLPAPAPSARSLSPRPDRPDEGRAPRRAVRAPTQRRMCRLERRDDALQPARPFCGTPREPRSSVTATVSRLARCL